MGLLAPLLTRNWSGANDRWYPISSYAQDTSAGVDVSPETALNCSDFLACIRVMSETVAKLPANIIKKTDKGRTRSKALEHPMYTVLHDAPNSEMTKFTFYEMIIVDLVTWGRSYHQIVWNNGGRVDSLWRFNPARMEVKRGAKNELVYVYKTQSGTPKAYLPRDELDIVGPQGGRSLVSLARESIGLASAAAQYGGSFFANDATAGVVIKHPGQRRMDDASFKRLKREIEEVQRGAKNARKTLILEQGMDISRMSLPPNDAQFLETRRFAKEEIAGWCLVPPHLIGANEHSTYTNIEHQERAGVTNMAMPWTCRIENAVNNKFFLTPERNHRLEFDFKALMRGDSEARSKYYQTMISMGAYNRNEVRALEDFNPMPGEQGEIYTVQMATVDLKQVANGELFGPAAAKPAPEIKIEEEERSLLECDCNNHPLQLTWEEREMTYRSIAGPRLQLREIWRKPLVALGKRIVSAEVAEIRKQIKKHRSERQIDAFKVWLDDFYKAFQGNVQAAALPAFMTYAEQVNSAAAIEIGEAAPEVDEFTQSYANAFAQRYTGSSNGQLQNMDEFEEIEQRIEEWEEDRPENVADRERYQLESAVAAFVFLSYKRSRTWVTAGKNCPACNRMSGRTATWEEPFLNAGDEVGDADSDQTPVKTYSDTWHTPLHRGCDCYIVGS